MNQERTIHSVEEAVQYIREQVGHACEGNNAILREIVVRIYDRAHEISYDYIEYGHRKYKE